MYTILVDSVDYYGKRIEKNNFQSIERYLARIITGGFSNLFKNSINTKVILNKDITIDGLIKSSNLIK